MSDALIEYGSEVEREGNAGLQVLAPTGPELTAVLAGLKTAWTKNAIALVKGTIDGQACGWKVEIPNHFACRPRSGLGVGSPQKPTPGYYSPELSAVQNLIDSSVSPCSSGVWVAAVPDRSAQRRLPWRRIRGRSSAPDDACVIPSSSALGVGASESRDAGSGPREPRRVVAHARRTRRAVSVHSCFAEIELGGDRARLVRVARLSRNRRLKPPSTQVFSGRGSRLKRRNGPRSRRFHGLSWRG
jgi:hypothetical protein